LQWEDFDISASNIFKKLRSESDFYDVTLGCTDSNGQVLKAHKVILASFSSVFRDMLDQDSSTKMNNNTSLLLRGIPYRDLTSILDFIYQGEVKMAEERLSSFLTVAEDLKIDGLCNSRGVSSEDKTNRYQSIRTQRNITSTHHIEEKKGTFVQRGNNILRIDDLSIVNNESSLVEDNTEFELKLESKYGKSKNVLLNRAKVNHHTAFMTDIKSIDALTNNSSDTKLSYDDSNDDYLTDNKLMVSEEINMKTQDSQKQLGKKKKRRSSVWSFFSKNINEKSVACNVCKRKVSQGKEGSQDYGTSGMWKHLKCNHSEEYKMAQAMKISSENS